MVIYLTNDATHIFTKKEKYVAVSNCHHFNESER